MDHLKSIKFHFGFFLFACGISLSFTNHTHDMVSYRLIVFEGSDWCSHCIGFEKRILRDSAFLGAMKKMEVEIEKIDFPQRKKLSKEQKNIIVK